MGKIKHFNKLGQLQCRKCFKYKSIDCFYNDKNYKSREYKGTECKECQKIRKQKYWRLREEFNLDLHFRYLLYGCKQRVLGNTNKGKYKGIKFNITLKDLYKLYKKQNGLCVISGIEMTYIVGGGFKDKNISIDRIDNSKGYIKNNIQLVCSRINIMRGNLSYDELLGFCKNIVRCLK